jgi:hypothetical protein
MDTFSHVAKWITIKIITTISMSKGWKLHHLDIKTTFINGEITKEIYFKYPLEGLSR